MHPRAVSACSHSQVQVGGWAGRGVGGGVHRSGKQGETEEGCSTAAQTGADGWVGGWVGGWVLGGWVCRAGKQARKGKCAPGCAHLLHDFVALNVLEAGDEANLSAVGAAETE